MCSAGRLGFAALCCGELQSTKAQGFSVRVLLTCCNEGDHAALQHAAPQLAPLNRPGANLVLQAHSRSKSEKPATAITQDVLL